MDKFNVQRGPFLGAMLAVESFIYYLWLSIVVLGTVANSLNIIVFGKMGMRDNVTVTLFVLSISDLAFLFCHSFIAIGFIIERLLPEYSWPDFHPHIINIFPVSIGELLFRYSSIVSAFLALVRCMCVAKPLLFKSMFTISRTLKILAGLLLLTIALRTPILSNWRFIWDTNPRTNATYLTYTFAEYRSKTVKFNDITNTNIVTYLNFAVISACAAVLTYKLTQSSKFRQSLVPADDALRDKDGNLASDSTRKTDKQKLSTKESQVIRSVTLICIIYIVAQLPAVINALARLIEPEFSIFGRFSNLYQMSAQLITTFYLLNASVNIFIYLSYNSRYRAHFLTLFGYKLS